MAATPNLQSVTARIVELRTERWGPRGRAAFAAELGIGPSRYNYYEKGRMPPADFLVGVAEVCGVELRWLLLGQGPKYVPADRSAEPPASDPHAGLVVELRALLTQSPHLAGAIRGFLGTLREIDQLEPARARGKGKEKPASLEPERLIPVIGRTAAGVAHFWSEVPWAKDPHAAEQVTQKLLDRAAEGARAADVRGAAADTTAPAGEPSEAVSLVQLSVPDVDGVVEFLDSPTVRRRCPDAVAWRIDGESMSPRFEDGDLVVTSPRRLAVPDRPCVARLKNQIGVTCKIYRREGRDVDLIPVNEAFKPSRHRASRLEWALAVLWRVRLTTSGS